MQEWASMISLIKNLQRMQRMTHTQIFKSVSMIISTKKDNVHNGRNEARILESSNTYLALVKNTCNSKMLLKNSIGVPFRNRVHIEALTRTVRLTTGELIRSKSILKSYR